MVIEEEWKEEEQQRRQQEQYDEEEEKEKREGEEEKNYKVGNKLHYWSHFCYWTKKKNSGLGNQK